MNDLSKQAGVLNPEASTQRLGRIKLTAVFAVALVPVLLAMLMYFAGVGIPSKSSNKGDLLWPPLAFEALLAVSSAQAVSNAQAAVAPPAKPAADLLAKESFAKEPLAKWRLLLAGTAACTEQCEALLHTARQVHMSTGRELERVQRVFLALPEHGLPPQLQQRYPALVIAQSEQAALARQLRSASAQGYEVDEHAWALWLVDPLGNIVLHYGAEHDGYDVLADLKKLLKLSKIG